MHLYFISEREGFHIERTIDLKNVPMKEDGVHYDWSVAIGCECQFDYDRVTGSIKIIDSFKKGTRNYLTIEYNGETRDIVAKSFERAQLYNVIFGNNGAQFKYEIGQTFKDDNRDFTIIDREYRKVINSKGPVNRKFYKFHCNVCGYENWKPESSINDSHKYGCPKCHNSLCKVVEGVNDIPTSAPWMVPYFIGGEEEAKKYSKSSKNRIDMVCPTCGRIHKNVKIQYLNYHKKLNCVCQDSMSYPNKFMYFFFEQLGVKFRIEQGFPWSENKIYDDYIELDDGKTLICENHGGWHYTKNPLKHKMTLEDQQRNDQHKEDMAKANGIDYYVVLDCRESTKEWIVNSIMNSQLAELFDLSKVDFDQCDKDSSRNILFEVCRYKKEHPELFATDIAKVFHINEGTVRLYLNKGNNLGLCQYDSSKEQKRKGRMLRGNTEDSRPVECIDTGIVYHSASLFSDEYKNRTGVNINVGNIQSVCSGKRNHTRNLHFRYITKQEFNRIKLETPHLAVGNCFKKV